MNGVPIAVFLCLTVVLMGGAGFLAGQALARLWRPVWQVFLYGALMGCADRFLVYALFDGALLSVAGYLIDTAVILALSLVAYRSTRAARMVAQYPWRYRRAGPFGWREIGAAAPQPGREVP